MILGDCLDVMPTLVPRNTNLVVSDLPYGCSNCKWDVAVDLQRCEDEISCILRDVGIVLSFASESFLYKLRQCWSRSYKYALVWSKEKGSNFYAARFRPMVSHEFVGVWGNGRCYNPQKREGFKPNYRTEGTTACDFYKKPLKAKGTIRNTGSSRMPLSVLHFKKDKAHRRRGKNVYLDKAHSSQKPVALLDWLIRTYSNPGDMVLDPTSGSGTTAVSAAQNGRSVVCIEKDEDYLQASVDRVRKHCRDNLLDVKLEVRR